MFGIYTSRAIRAPRAGIKHNQIFGPFWAGFAVWLVRPIERALVARRVSPIVITLTSLFACAVGGVAIATDHLAAGALLYLTGGILDLLDGRLARALGRQSEAGALFDSVSDRWAELAMLAGFAWRLRDDGAWPLAVMAAIAGSLMVSYTRARAEGFGLELKSGAMQRAERILLVVLGTLLAAAFSARPSTAGYVTSTLGITLALCGGLSIWTAIGRWVEGYRALCARAVGAKLVTLRIPTDEPPKGRR